MPSQQEAPTRDQVLAVIRAAAAPGERVGVSVFFGDGIATADFDRAARQLIERTVAALGRSGDAVSIGKVHSYAKAVAIKADVEVIAALLRQPEVKTMLLTETKDVRPLPLGPSR